MDFIAYCYAYALPFFPPVLDQHVDEQSSAAGCSMCIWKEPVLHTPTYRKYCTMIHVLYIQCKTQNAEYGVHELMYFNRNTCITRSPLQLQIYMIRSTEITDWYRVGLKLGQTM